MENQERLKQAGVLNPQGELNPELSDAVGSLTPEEMDELIARRQRLSPTSHDDEEEDGEGDEGDDEEGDDNQGGDDRDMILAHTTQDDDDDDDQGDDRDMILAHPTPDDDDDDDEYGGGKGGGKGGGGR